MAATDRATSSGELRALALIMCERTITEEFTAQRSVIGTYHAIRPLEYPVVMPQIGIYVCLARGQNETEDVYLALLSPDGEFVVRSVLRVTDWGTVGIAEFTVTFRNVPFPAPGLYVLRLFAEGRVLMEKEIPLQTPLPPTSAQGD
jgi:hypothetical protein